MARKLIDIGQKGNDGTGDSLRDSFRKINDNFQELYSVVGVGEKLSFTGLFDTPNSFVQQDRKILSVNDAGNAIVFKRLVGTGGINIDYDQNPEQIQISSAFSKVQSDDAPVLGGTLRARSGANQYRILDLGTTDEPLIPLFKHEAVNKAYADGKISLAGTDSVTIETGSPIPDPQQGIMTGPLILSRDPISDDDVGPFGGLIAATKRYVDNSSYFSKINLYVSSSGEDNREDLAKDQKGRALAYSFKSIEAAAKRAEELMLEASFDLGPYRKKLTFNNRASDATLSAIVRSPLSGIGATAVASMTVDTIEINNVGTNYLPDDILSISTGTFTSQILIKIKTTEPGSGKIIDWEVTSQGDYTVLPGSVDVPTTTNSQGGSGATFNINWKVNTVTVTAGGTGYDLVSVRFEGGGGGVNAFAEASVTDGVVTGVNVLNPGFGYTQIPTIAIELPRLKIFTNGVGTDYTSAPGPSRDIREGLQLRGITSGAQAVILSHDGSFDGLDEVFDVDIISGTFIIGEAIEYGDPIKSLNITILIESGTYEENFPIKVSQNVSLAGDEFRRIILRPKKGMSTSPWANVHFCRDKVVDGLTVATQRYGRHYLTDSSQPIYPLINNRGGYKFAARLLELNRAFIKSEVIGFITAQVNLGLPPFTTDFVYNQDLCKRDVGLLVDAMIFDLTWGGQDRTVSAALKYYESASSLIAITEQKDQTLAAINYINTVAQAVIDNVPPAVTFQTVDSQVISPAIFSEQGSDTVITALFGIITGIISDEDSFNAPKNNDQMDVFLMNDATRVFQMSITGAGGFALVLDPTGQILTKSPYAQVGSVFSKSIGVQSFAGSLLIDGFAGNQQFLPVSKSEDGFLLDVSELVRKPQTPFSFFRNGISYRVNFVRNYQFNPAGSTAQFVLDELTPYTPILFEYNESKCFRDVGLIIDAVTNDIVFGTNYQSVKAGLAYRRAYSNVVLDEQIYETIKAIEFSRDQVLALVSDPSAKTIISSRYSTLTSLIRRGESSAPVLIFPNTVNAVDGIANSVALLRANRSFIQAEVIAWINSQIAGNIAPFSTGFVYNSATCSRDVGYIVDALSFDLAYGGNISVVDNANSYWYDGTVITGQTAQSAAAYTHMKDVVQDIVQNISITPSATNTLTQVTTLPAGSLAAANTLGTLIDIVIDGVQDQSSIPTSPTQPIYANSTNTLFNEIRTDVQLEKAVIQQATIDEINNNISKFELVTPGNRSMISNDFTCINDMGYGLLATNGGLTEAVSMFTYYCYTAYYALNGGQIRSIGGSSAHGVYALIAEGSDPLEVPDIVSLAQGLSQGATVYAPDGVAPFQSVIRGLTLYVTYDSFVPLNQSEVEINFDGEIIRYSISGADAGPTQPPGVAKLNISTSGQNNTASSGLLAAVPDGTRVTIRSSYELLLDDVQTVIGTRPSTALAFFEDPEKIYRVLSATTAGVGVEQAILTLRENYDYVEANVFSTGQPEVQPADHGDVGDTQIAITDLSPGDSLRAVGSQFCWLGTVHTVTAYENSVVTDEVYARIKFSPALVDSVVFFDLDGTPTRFLGQVVLKLGAQAGANGDITKDISTARFTGHDLLDIGTGSYADTNYPNVIFGIPANPKEPENEVIERGKGRVFYITTDQDGNFKVGPFFRVDQGTGTVTFAAAIALSSLDGLGFKRGVSISEFSIDDTMTDNATDTVPTEQATRAYIDRRLGINHNAGIVDPVNLIPAITGGYMALNGNLPMKADMNLNGFKIIGLEDPINPLDAVNKRWHTLGNLQDAAITGPVTNASFLVFSGAGTSTVNAAMTGDVTVTRSGNTITSAITAGSIVDADINSSAAIAQSKLNLSTATVATSLALSTRGIASFNSVNFGSSSGFISIKTNGVTLANIVQATGRTVIGNSALTTGNVSEIAMTEVVNLGAAIKKNQYTEVGYLKRTALGDNTQDTNYTIITDATGNTPNTLVLRDAEGSFSGQVVNSQELRLNNKTFASFQVIGDAVNNTGSLRLFSYRGVESLSLGDGATAADKKTIYRNNEHVFLNLAGTVNGTIKVGTITAGGATENGTLTGVWTLSSGSFFNASAGTLQSTSLTTGAAATAGTIIGNWTLGPGSNLTLGTGTINASSGTLQSTTLTTGTALAAGTITGAWTLSASSTLVASSIQNQANSATITASSINTINNIVRRDASGNFAAGLITASLSGNASTASAWATARTITLGGDLTGNVSIDGSANVTLTATIAADSVALGTDTTGNYAGSVAVSGSGLSITGTAGEGTAYTVTSNATNANTASTIVFRDASGNFSAGTITAALNGNASTATSATSATSATTATNANNINISAITSTNTTSKVVLVGSNATGNQSPFIDDGLTYNASTNALTATTFVGALTGAASALNTGSNYQVNALGIGVASPTTAGQLRVNAALAVGNTAPSGTGEIRATGEITAFFSSDKRLKENIVPIENALGKLKEITGVMFDWTDEHVQSRGGEDGYFVRKHDTGIIAQDVERVLPEVVVEKDDGYKAVRYEKLAGLIIQAINELADQVEEIKKKLD
jgi:hypothetical protein